MSAILFVLTSHDRMSNGDPTGVWLEEYAVPWTRLTEAGHDVTVASVSGGDVPVDPNSEPTGEQAREWGEAIERLKGTPAFDAFSADDFDAVYLPGGHGTMFDMPDNQGLHELLLRFDEKGGIVASVCHAPAVFSGMKRRDGQPFVSGRRVTAFTDSEERAVGGEQKVPFLLESRLRELGADVSTSGDWASHVVVDGRLITGQNSQSSEAVAGKLLTTLTQ